MTVNANIQSVPAEETREITATRVFDAPRNLVFRMWTEPEHIAQWWGPKGFTNTIHEMDVRPGGVWRFIMHGPDGVDYNNKIIYREVVRPERLVYSHVSGPVFDATVTFEEQGQKTRVQVRMMFETAELRNKTVETFGAIEGLNQTLGRLEEKLKDMAGTDEFLITRTFDAPRDLMWKAWTEPERLARWFGPKGTRIISSKNDLRPGGIYLYGMQTPDGSEIWGKWVYREVVKPERLVFVNSFSDKNSGITRHPMAPDWPLELLSTVTFTEKQGKTTINLRWAPLNATENERKTFAGSHDSMTKGWTGTFEKLEAYLPKA